MPVLDALGTSTGAGMGGSHVHVRLMEDFVDRPSAPVGNSFFKEHGSR